MASINDYLPREVLVKIFSYYMESEGPFKFLRNVSPVCKLWKDLSTSYLLWNEVSWKSLEWNSDYLLEIGKRGCLAFTRTLNLSCQALTDDESGIPDAFYPRLKFEDFLQLIDYCHNLKVLNVRQINLTTETTLQSIESECSLQERYIVDSVAHECDPKYENFKMVPTDDKNKIILKCILRYFQDVRNEGCSDLRSGFGHDGRIISKIADCCPLLEELHFRFVRVDDIEVNHLFPIAKIQQGCPKLKVLDISNFDLDWSNDEELGAFKEIITFSASDCDFLDQDVSRIFKNSTELEDLILIHFRGLVFSHIPEIPTEKVRCLIICTSPDKKVSEHLLEKAVKKWRLTLRKLLIFSGDRNLTQILSNLVQEWRDGHNYLVPNRVIEEISVTGHLDEASMKSLIRDCLKLRSFYISGCSIFSGSTFFDTRESLEEYLKS